MKAYQLLEKPDSWTQVFFARDKNGEDVDLDSPQACKWCLMGAINRCYKYCETREKVTTQIFEYFNSKGIFSVTKWNDAPERKHEEVVGVLKELDI